MVHHENPYDNNHIKEPMKDIAPDTAEIGAVALELPLYGISLAMFTNTIVALMQRCSSADRKMMVVASAYLLLSSAHAITGIVRLNDGFIHSRDTFRGGPPKFFSNGIETGFLIQGMIYIVETLLTDAVVIYRCFKVWRRWTVIVVPIMLWCLALASGLGLWSALGPAAVAHGGPGVSIFKYAKWIKALFASTLATNLISTGLLAYRIWHIDHEAAPYRASQQKHHLYHIIRVVIDSGILYSATLLVTLITFVLNSNSQFILLDMLAPIMPITFYMIIIRLSRAQIRSQASSQGTFSRTDLARRMPRSNPAFPLQVHISQLSHTVGDPEALNAGDSTHDNLVRDDHVPKIGKDYKQDPHEMEST